MRIRQIIGSDPAALFPAALFAAAAVYFAFVDWRYSVCAAAACAATIAVFFAFAVKRYRSLESKIKYFNEAIALGNLSETDRIAAFPIPAVLCDERGDIYWGSDLFYRDVLCAGSEKPKAVNISELGDFLPLSDMAGKRVDASSGQSRFTATVSELGDNSWAVYFHEDTRLKLVETEYKRSRPVVMLMTLDVLELSSPEREDDADLITALEKNIVSWLSGFDCVVRRYGASRFLAITESEKYERMLAGGFELLDKVKKFEYNGLRTDASLAVGIGIERSIREGEKSARLALDMARGRGGDQAAVRTRDGYDFIGGLSQTVERVSAAQVRLISEALGDLLASCSNCIVMGHRNSDFDCVGASLGISALARALGVECVIAFDEKTTLSKPLTELFRGASSNPFVSLETALGLAGGKTLLIVTDNQRMATVDCPQLLDRCGSVVVIDHHRMSVDHISDAALFFHDPNASSACEMTSELLRLSPAQVRLTRDEADGLFAGMLLDTKNFTLHCGVRTFETAAYLRSCGADPVRVRGFFANTLDEKRIINEIVESANIRLPYAVAVCEKPYPKVRLLCSMAADELLGVVDVDASFVIYPTESGATAVSARSRENVNVQLVMEKLGGGGHRNMAAAMLGGVTLQDAIERLHSALAEYEDEHSEMIKQEEKI
ncbi:MAG: DHH family phosphoesterase [Clostridia bacterium]|nr:DHH family phosphoesterase [Clostridia bacterium]